MKDTDKVKELIAQAIREMPTDFALSKARSRLQEAVAILTRNNQPVPKPLVIKQGNGPPVLRETIGAIDAMIDSERQKIQDLAERRRKRQTREDEDESPLLG